ncbi:S10 family peptidase [Hyphomonas oceanitis]|uniref:S10 family peptidase n=1 Tax=Hyphomonas oceanitis TaxID=81033 RepID=UPI003001B8FE
MNFRNLPFSGRLPEFVCAALLGVSCVSVTGCATPETPPAIEHAVTVAKKNLPGPISRSAQGVFDGETVAYTAAIESTPVEIGIDGKGADIVSFSYVAQQATDDRPVLFVFNGGPIAASLWLHIGAVGPYRVSLPDDISQSETAATLIPNTDSPLNVADIVLFDPASTGYSRVRDGVDPSVYYSVEADGAQCADFIEAWLAAHGRTGSPVFILGESYGTIRAAEAAGQLAERGPEHAANGVFLMGQAVNIIEYAQRKENIISYVASLPTLAATAWELGKVDKIGKTFQGFMAEAKAFGETEYLTALYQGNKVDPQTRDAVAAKLEAFTGIPAAYYVEHNNRISKETYRVELLKADDLILGRSDARYTGQNQPGADPASVLSSVYEDAFRNYIKSVFGFEVGDDYKLYANVDEWIYGPPSPFAAFAFGKRLDPAFAANPDFRLFIGNGYQDTMTTVGASDYAVSQSDWPLDRVRTAYYKGGHMAYSVDESAKAFGADIREWITGAPHAGAGE